MVLMVCGLLASAALVTLFYPENCQGKQLNYWESVCQYFTGSKRTIRTRQEMLGCVEGTPSIHTLDYYRRILARAGYIRMVSPGKYRVVEKIPNDLTTKHARFLAYDLDKLFEPIPKNYPGWAYAVK